MTVRPAKTQICLGIRPVWSESSLSAWRKLGSLATHWAHSEDSDQTGRIPRLIWVFAGRKAHFVGFVMRRLKYLLRKFWVKCWHSCYRTSHVLTYFKNWQKHIAVSRSWKWLNFVTFSGSICIQTQKTMSWTCIQIIKWHLELIEMSIRAVWSALLLFTAWIVQYLYLLSPKFQYSS